jgi:hypothetical protein
MEMQQDIHKKYIGPKKKKMQKVAEQKIPQNSMQTPSFKDDEVCITFQVRLKKSQIPVKDETESAWREDVWTKIKGMQSLDDTIILDSEDPNFALILKEDYNADIGSLTSAIASTVCLNALTRKSS